MAIAEHARDHVTAADGGARQDHVSSIARLFEPSVEVFRSTPSGGDAGGDLLGWALGFEAYEGCSIPQAVSGRTPCKDQRKAQSRKKPRPVDESELLR